LSPSEAKTPIGQPFMELAVVESTNIYAMDLLQANLAGHGTAVFAHQQTAGKGQRGKRWTGEPGLNIALSVIVDCSFLTITRQFPLSSMAALACHDFFSRHAGDETRIKWPNDLYWRDRKAGGILIENLVRGNKWQWAVAGIGINLNQVAFPGSLKNAVSLKQITGKNFDPVVLAKQFCECLEARYQQLKKGKVKEMLAAYNSHLYKRGEEVKLKSGPIAFSATVKEVSATGELLVLNGLKESFRFGEIEWLVAKA